MSGKTEKEVKTQSGEKITLTNTLKGSKVDEQTRLQQCYWVWIGQDFAMHWPENYNCDTLNCEKWEQNPIMLELNHWMPKGIHVTSCIFLL